MTSSAPAAVTSAPAPAKAARASKKAAAAAAVTTTAAPVVEAPPAAPKAKRAPTPFIVFAKEKREEIKTKNPTAKFTDVAKLLGSLWNSLSEEEKSKYGKVAPKKEA